MGPQHPSTHGVFRMVLSLEGERIIDCVPHIGYLHRGSERLCEGENYSQIITLFDRLDYISNINNEQCFVMAVEKLMGVQVPPRAEYVRVILSELNRIASHMLFYGTFAIDAGAMTPIMIGFRDRELIQALFESVTGARMMHNYLRIGGVKEDVPEWFKLDLGRLLDQLRAGFREAEDLLNGSDVFLERTMGVGILPAEAALDYGVTGPALRASGVGYDVRRAEPYSVYPELEFDIPVGKVGDCYDRYWVRMREVEQSLRIVEQCLERLPEGPIMGKAPRLIRPPKGEVYVRTENPRGELGVYLVSQGGSGYPYRVKIRGPSFCNLMALRQLLRGVYVADSVVILGSLDIVLGEVDR
ncbi:MAG: NADH-quinone oxidoreductase subunit D [Chloroflexi bacterium]|nr:NADH-quinone oxidoreductase subunit D [Chloroflexota bacterium]